MREGRRVVGVRVTREPEWSGEDVALMLAHLELEAEPRNQYGVLLSEATDIKNQFAYQGRAPKAPVIDWSAAAVEKERDAYYAQYKDAPRHGHMWVLKPPAAGETPPSQ